MNVEHAPTEMTESREQHSSARVPRRWLLLARGIWITLVILTLGIFFASLPVYIAQLQTPCARTACAGQLFPLTPEQAGALKGMGLSLGAYAAYIVTLTLASVVVCLVISAVIAWRRSDDRMALLVALLLVTFGPIIATSSVSGSSSPWRVPSACLYFLALALLVLVFLLFPSGQFVPRWTRWTFVVFLVGQIPSIFFPDAPFTLHTNASLVGYLMLIGEAAILAVVQLYRYRRVSSPLERQQTKWVVFGLAIPIAVFVSGTVLALIFPVLDDPSSPSGSLYQLAFAAISTWLALFFPLSFGFAMLRNRLWEIDVLINRALVYGALTVILTGVYVGLVIGLQALLRGIISQDNSVAIVLSTLAIAALFQPLRRRIQRIIDRRFYRSKYDAAKTAAAFSATLRNEVDLMQLSENLITVVQETMQPAHVSPWLRPSEHDGKQRAP
jgi:hypothetical protein